MKNVSQAFKDAFGRSTMRIKTKAHIELGNNRFNDSQLVTASSTKRMRGKIDYITFWHPEDAFNNKNRNAMRVAVCDQGARAVGKNSRASYRVASVSNNELDAVSERGWWSLFKSDPDSILGWNEYSYDALGWKVPVTYLGGLPASWPTILSRWIWSDTNARMGPCWFRRHFHIDETTTYTVYATADDAFQLYLDGDYILEGGDKFAVPFDPTSGQDAIDLGFAQHLQGPHGFNQTYKITLTLTEGDHVVAAKGLNYPIIGFNPGGFLFALLKDSDSSVILKSDLTWSTMGYLMGPGHVTARVVPEGSMTPGTYFYRVASVVNGIETAPSFTVKVKIINETSKVELRWDNEATSYKVYRGTDQFIQDIFANSSSNYFTDYGFMEQIGSPVSGTFARPEWVKSTFDLRRINQIDIWLTEGYSNMREVTLQYLDRFDVWQTVAQNYELQAGIYHYEIPIDDALCKGLRGYINKTFIGNTYARISELQGLFVINVDSSNDIVSANVNQQREEYVNTVPVGMTRANTLNLTLQNVDQKYSPENKGDQ